MFSTVNRLVVWSQGRVAVGTGAGIPTPPCSSVPGMDPLWACVFICKTVSDRDAEGMEIWAQDLMWISWLVFSESWCGPSVRLSGLLLFFSLVSPLFLSFFSPLLFPLPLLNVL